MSDRFPVVRHHRSGVTHAAEQTEGIQFTVCGRIVGRKLRPDPGLHVADVSCERCWIVIGARMPARRRVALAGAAG